MKNAAKKLLAFCAAGLGSVMIAASADAAVLLSETFSYPDGNLNDVAPDPQWDIHSGAAPQTVTGGRALINDANNGDHNRRFSTITSGAIFAGLNATVDPNDIPTSAAADTNAYFFHLSDVTGAGAMGNGFRGRVWAVPGNEAGKFRFALSTTSGVATAFSNDLDPGTDYRIVVSYDFATANSQLWINPADDAAAPTLTGTPEATAIAAGLSAVALRGGNQNQGDVFVDNVVIADSFADARQVPEPAGVTLVTLAGVALGARRRRV